MDKKWLPVETNDLDMVFGPMSFKGFLPPYEEIPLEFRRGHTDWNRLFSDWFFFGLASLDMEPKEGIDVKKAMRHIKTIMGSFEPKHEHKEAGVAYLLSEWFTDPKWTKAERKGGEG